MGRSTLAFIIYTHVSRFRFEMPASKTSVVEAGIRIRTKCDAQFCFDRKLNLATLQPRQSCTASSCHISLQAANVRLYTLFTI